VTKPARLQVLFCGRDMHYGYVFTKEALQDDAGVEVRGCRGACGLPSQAAATAAVAVFHSTHATPSPCMPQVHQCDRAQVAHALPTADVAVPLMARLDAQVGMCSLPGLPPQPICSSTISKCALPG
jgi:hypothetical protein